MIGQHKARTLTIRLLRPLTTRDGTRWPGAVVEVGATFAQALIDADLAEAVSDRTAGVVECAMQRGPVAR